MSRFPLQHEAMRRPSPSLSTFSHPPFSVPPPRSPLSPPSLSADVPTLEVLERELAWLKEHLSQLGSPVVFCHNDLLCKNIIYDSTKGAAASARAGGRVLLPRLVPGQAQEIFHLELKFICRREMGKEQIAP